MTSQSSIATDSYTKTIITTLLSTTFSSAACFSSAAMFSTTRQATAFALRGTPYSFGSIVRGARLTYFDSQTDDCPPTFQGRKYSLHIVNILETGGTYSRQPDDG